MFIDTHCHISSEYYENIDKVIFDNISSSVEKMIISGCDEESINESLVLLDKYDCLFATIGYHPSEAKKLDKINFDELKNKILSNKKIVGIGEIGLDYYYGKDDKEEQLKLFEKQLAIAEELNMPVVIHSRDAVSDTINTLKKYKTTGVIHCFSGSLETANIYINMGYKLGIGGVLTFKNSKLYEVIENIDISNIVLETDSPYLSPEPFRGSLNSSKNIPIIAQKIATIKGLSLHDVMVSIEKNTNDVFDLAIE